MQAGYAIVGRAKRIYFMAAIDDIIIGSSESIKKLKEQISYLISGESGTGKTLAAMVISQISQSALESLLQFNCAASSGRFKQKKGVKSSFDS